MRGVEDDVGGVEGVEGVGEVGDCVEKADCPDPSDAHCVAEELVEEGDADPADPLTRQSKQFTQPITDHLNKAYDKWDPRPLSRFSFNLPPSSFPADFKIRKLGLDFEQEKTPWRVEPLSPTQLSSIWETRKFKVESSVYSIGSIWLINNYFFSSTHDREKLFQKLVMVPLNFFHRVQDHFTPSRFYYNYKWVRKGPNLFSGLKNMAALFVQLFDLFLGSPTFLLRGYKKQSLANERVRFVQARLAEKGFAATRELCEHLQLASADVDQSVEVGGHSLQELVAQQQALRRKWKVLEAFNKNQRLRQEALRSAVGGLHKDWSDIVSQRKAEIPDCDDFEYQLLQHNISVGANEYFAERMRDPPEGSLLKPSVATALSAKLMAMNAIDALCKEAQTTYDDFARKAEIVVKAKHPYLKRVPFWYNRRIRHMLADFRTQQQAELVQKTLDHLRSVDSESAEMWAVSLAAEQEFERDKEAIWAQMKERLKYPSRHYRIRRKIYPPYQVVKSFNDGQFAYSLQNVNWLSIGTDVWFFRVANDLCRYFYWSMNASYYSFRYAFSGRFGLLGMVSCCRYFRGYTVDATGAIRNDIRPVTPILVRFAETVQRAMSDRRHFEDSPDNALFGKTCGRVFNVLYNYVFRVFFSGVVGTLILHTLLNLVAIVALVCYGSLSWLWMVVVLLLRNLCRYLVWDFHSFSLPDKTPGKVYNSLVFFKSKRRLFPLFQILFEFLFNGVVQLLLSLLLPLSYPLLAAVVFCCSMVAYSFKFLWDCFAFFVVLKCFARVPRRDTGFAKRIAGPGISSNLYYSVSLEDVVILVQSELEKVQLLKLKHELQQLLFCHANHCQAFTASLLDPLVQKSSVPTSDLLHQRRLRDVADSYFARLQDQIAKRVDQSVQLSQSLNSVNLKFKKNDLDKLKAVVQEMVLAKTKELHIDDFIWQHFQVDQGKPRLLTHRVLKSVFKSDSAFVSAEEFDEQLVAKNEYSSFKEKQEVTRNIVKGVIDLDNLVLPEENNRVHNVVRKTAPLMSVSNYLDYLVNPSLAGAGTMSPEFFRVMLNTDQRDKALVKAQRESKDGALETKENEEQLRVIISQDKEEGMG